MQPFGPKTGNRDDEPLELRGISKNKVYDLLAERYCLPERESRAITRDYLLRVHSGKVLRIGLNEMGLFKAKITPKLMKRAKYVNGADAAAKLNSLLKERGEPELGFTREAMPDNDWLFHVARFLDPSNTAGLFQRPLQLPNDSKWNSEKVLLAQKAAEETLLISNGLLGKRYLTDSLQEMSAADRSLSCKKRQLSRLGESIRKLTQKVQEEETQVEIMLSVASEAVLRELTGSEEERAGEEGRKKMKRVKEV
jgi:hypothetical protein